MREFGAAFGVLALIFLSFAHQPVYAKVPIGSVLDDTFYITADFCGGGPGSDNPGAFNDGCDACRISNEINLPPSEDLVFLAPTPVRHRLELKICDPQDYQPAGHARAPPGVSTSL